MNLTRQQLKAQFDRAVKLGWLPYFEEAAKITKGYFDVADLMAIGSRETNLDPKWLKRKGDNGHGAGLMQIDDRSFPEFTNSTKWQDARLGILYGAKVLMEKWRDYADNIGKRLRVKGKTYTAKPASGQVAQHIVISSYNCGRWSQYAYANGQRIDRYTTGHDYGADVMERAAVIRGWLTNSAAGVTMPVQENPKAALAATGASSPTSEVLQTGLPAINAPAADIPPPEQTQPSVTNTVVEQKIIEETPVGVVTTTKTAESVAAPVEVQKETPSWLVKIGAPFTILTGWGINAGSLIQSKIEQMTVQQIAYMVAAIGLIALGIWWWMRAAKAAQNRTLALMDKAADPNLTTVILTDKKAQQPSVSSPVPSE